MIAREDQLAPSDTADRGVQAFPSVSNRTIRRSLSFLGYDELGWPVGPSTSTFSFDRRGARVLKNYHLPWETIILSRAILHPDTANPHSRSDE